MLTDEQRAKAKRLFREHGFGGQLLIAPPTGDDERIFVLPTADYAALRAAADLTESLQSVLGRPHRPRR